MEKRIKRIEIVVFLTLLLVLINFLRPYMQNMDFLSSEINEIEETKDLPPDLAKENLNKIAYKVKIDFNRSDWDELYNVLGEFAKAQLSPADVKEGFYKLKSAVGKIETYAYSHYVYEGFSDDADWFEIHYKCRFENGKGTIKISTRTVDQVSEVIGLNIVLDDF